jgi:hypothetical protein
MEEAAHLLDENYEAGRREGLLIAAEFVEEFADQIAKRNGIEPGDYAEEDEMPIIMAVIIALYHSSIELRKQSDACGVPDEVH